MNITMTREEIMMLIGANNDRMKYLNKTNKLLDELKMHGYKLIKQYKVGRNSVYDLEPIETDEWLQYQSLRNIKKKEEHTVYVENRLTNGMTKSRRGFVRELDIGISESSAKRYDEMLLEDNVIKLKLSISNKRVNISTTNVVYRMFDMNDEVIYIGKSDELKKRMYSHSIEEKDNDWFNKDVVKIEYISFKEYGDCSLAEIYFITKVKPKHNKDYINWDTSITIKEFDKLKWKNANFEEELVEVYDKGERYDEFIKMLGVNE